MLVRVGRNGVHTFFFTLSMFTEFPIVTRLYRKIYSGSIVKSLSENVYVNI